MGEGDTIRVGAAGLAKLDVKTLRPEPVAINKEKNSVFPPNAVSVRR